MIKVYVFLGFLIFGTSFLITYLLFKPDPRVLSLDTGPIGATQSAQKNKFPVGSTKIIVAGDIMLGRSVMSVSLSKGNPDYPFEKVADKLRGADLVFANLENPVISDCPKSDSGFKFCALPIMLIGLKNAGVDIVNVANNHTGNYGEAGFSETMQNLKNYGIDFVGNKNLVIKSINGTNFGFLGFDFVDKKPTDADHRLITDSKKEVDVLIVMTHGGTEYTAIPSSSQKSAAIGLTAAGADVVVGSHPHWVQPLDYINEKPVFYSLGNFIFDQAWSEETKKGLAVQLTYSNKNLEAIENMPIYMGAFAQPEWR